MAALTLENPLFATYAVAASLMVLKAVSMSWLTVARMIQVGGGFRSPEDLRKTPRIRPRIPSNFFPTSAWIASAEFR